MKRCTPHDWPWHTLCAIALACATAGVHAGEPPPRLTWSQLAPLPDPIGVAGPFAGLSGGSLLVAGGANFPEGPPWEGFPKRWQAQVHVLPNPRAAWVTAAAQLPRPLAYGVAVPLDDSLVCVGGCDADRCYADLFALRWDAANGRLTCATEVRLAGPASRSVRLPELPVPLAFLCGAVAGHTVYVAGGQESMAADAAATRHFLRLRLDPPASDMTPRWESLPWPAEAPPRILAVTIAERAAGEDHVYLISGRETAAGRPAKLLRDAWRFRSRASAWQRLADPPRCVMAGCGLAWDDDQLLLLGGDDGRHWGADLAARHPGFPRDMLLAYSPTRDAWSSPGTLPVNQVTTAAVRWGEGLVIPSGEVRPGVRSSRVWWAVSAERLTDGGARVAPAGAGQGTAAASSGQPARRPADPHPHTRFGGWNWCVLLTYLASMVGIGVYCSGREKSTDDFFLAGQRIPWWAAGLSIIGTQLSAITFMAIPATAFREDWTRMISNLMIMPTIVLVIYCYLPFFRRLRIYTAYEYLERRFHLSVRLLASALFVVFQLGRMAIVLYLPAIALSAVTGMDVLLCIALMGLLATAYTVLGGIEAVIWTDVVQVLVLLVGALVCAVVVSWHAGGLATVITRAVADQKLKMIDLGTDPTRMVLWVMIVGGFFTNLVPYTSDQTVIQRYLTTRDERQAGGGLWMNFAMTLPAALIFYGLGTLLYVHYAGHPELPQPQQADRIVPWFVMSELPPGVAGLVIAGIFAAAMSSLDSSMNSVATALVTDFYRRLRHGVTDLDCLRLAKWLTCLLGGLGTGVAMVMAQVEITYLFDFFNSTVGLLGGSLAGVFMLAVFTRRAHAWGALVGLVSGAAATLAIALGTRVQFYLYAAVGCLTCLLAGYLASLLLPGPVKDLAGLTMHTPPTERPRETRGRVKSARTPFPRDALGRGRGRAHFFRGGRDRTK